MPVCPTCGSEVARGVLPDEADLAALRDRIDVQRQPLVLFLLLWRAGGRIVPHRALLDALEQDRDEALGPDALSSGIKRLRRRLGAVGWPLRIVNANAIGYALTRPRGWDWRDQPELRDFPANHFDFKEG